MTHTLCFGVPSMDMLHADFAMSLVFIANKCGVPYIICNSKSSNVAVQRNHIVDQAQKFGATHLLFLDSDMKLPHDTARRLLAHGKDIVGAIYVRRVPPYDLLGQVEGEARSVETGLVKFEKMPTGCLLIDMKVFEKLKVPYFRFGVDEEQGIILSEDYMFCDAARAAGFDLWCDIDLSKDIGHIGQMVYKVT